MSEKETTLPSLRNRDWRTVKSETEKVNNLLTNILTNDITELAIWYTQDQNKSVKKSGSPWRPQAESQNSDWNSD